MDRPPVAPPVRRAALGTAVVFATAGAVFGSWVARVPGIRDAVGADPRTLGFALLGSAVGSLATMPFAGRLSTRFGPQRVVVAMAVLSGAALVGVGLARSPAALFVMLAGYGVGFGVWDVAMNIHGSAVDRVAGRPWMPRYHAAFSAGGIVGSALGALSAGRGVPVPVHLTVTGALGVVLVVAGTRTWLPHVPPTPQPDERRGPSVWSVLDRRLVLVAVLVMASTLAEGAAADWLALYLVDERAVAAGPAAVGFTAFATAMAAVRLAGTGIIERLGRGRAIRAAGVVLVCGVVLTVAAPWTPLAYVGAVLWGAGVALVFPAGISAAGEHPTRPADAIAAVSTLGYGGFLLGPPLIGLLAGAVGLGEALWALVLLGLLVVVLAPAAGRQAPVAVGRDN